MRNLPFLFASALVAWTICPLGSVVHAQQEALQDGGSLPGTESQDHTDTLRAESQDHTDSQDTDTDADVPQPTLDPPALSSPLAIPNAPPQDLLPPQRQLQNRDRVQQLMQEALRSDGRAPASGDQVLDDVLRVLRQRGSVLDGSTLDPEHENTPPSPDGPNESSKQPNDSLGKRFRRIPSPSVAPQRARAAELLLRTARVLENLGPVGENRRKLIQELRREAVRVLTKHNPLGERGVPIQ